MKKKHLLAVAGVIILLSGAANGWAREDAAQSFFHRQLAHSRQEREQRLLRLQGRQPKPAVVVAPSEAVTFGTTGVFPILQPAGPLSTIAARRIEIVYSDGSYQSGWVDGRGNIDLNGPRGKYTYGYVDRAHRVIDFYTPAGRYSVGYLR